MAANVPEECPLCVQIGIKSAIKLYQISFEEATALCESPECMYPLSAGGIIIQNQLNGPNGPLSNENMMPSPKKQDICISEPTGGCLVANTSAHSLATLTSAGFTATSYNWHSNITTPVYQPTPVAPKQPVGFSWLSPPSSTQTSPALSIISASDKEVELAMKDKDTITFDRLTPSPSPLPKQNFDDAANKNDDIDSFLNEISSGFINEPASSPIDFAQEFPDFFGSEENNTTSCDTVDVFVIDETSTPIERLPIDAASLAPDEFELKAITEVNVPPATQGDFSCSSLLQQSLTSIDIGDKGKQESITPYSRSQQNSRATSRAKGTPTPSEVVRAIRLANAKSFPAGVQPSPIRVPVKQKDVPDEATTSIVKTPLVQTGIKRPAALACTGDSKRPRLSNPTPQLTKSTPAKNGAASGRKSSSTPTPSTSSAKNPTTPQVVLQVASDGTPVFLVQPRAVSTTPTTSTKPPGGKKTPSSTPRPKSGTRTPKDKPKKTPAKPQSSNKKKLTDESFIESIISNFVQQANSRKLPPAKK